MAAKMRVKRGASSHVLLIGIMALLIAGSFLAYSAYSALTKSQVTKEQELAIRPLEGKLKAEALKDLAKRRQFSQAEMAGVVSLDYSEGEEKGEAVENQPSQPATESSILIVSEETEEASVSGSLEE